jgi:DNA-binding Lrp family transcriptional regulator
LGISTSTAIRRYNNLKRNGIIRAVIQINPAKIGYPIEACFRLTIDSQWGLNSIAEKIAEIPNVVGILKTTGPHDLSVFAEIKNFEHLIALETDIANIPGVKEMEAASLNQFPMLPYPREHISTF